MVLGSEGRLGVITEVTVQVHRIPEVRVMLGYLFPSWEAGLAAMQAISTSDAHRSITRHGPRPEFQPGQDHPKVARTRNRRSAQGMGPTRAGKRGTGRCVGPIPGSLKPQLFKVPAC
jgi:alkyldihydroxyacetonephosphate synthase